jgi:hypothetical protein
MVWCSMVWYGMVWYGTVRYPDILPKDTLPKDILPKDILPNGRFAERTFCRTDSFPKGQHAESRDVILSKCLEQ